MKTSNGLNVCIAFTAYPSKFQIAKNNYKLVPGFHLVSLWHFVSVSKVHKIPVSVLSVLLSEPNHTSIFAPRLRLYFQDSRNQVGK